MWRCVVGDSPLLLFSSFPFETPLFPARRTASHALLPADHLPHRLRRFLRLPSPTPFPVRRDDRPCVQRRGRAISTWINVFGGDGARGEGAPSPPPLHPPPQTDVPHALYLSYPEQHGPAAGPAPAAGTGRSAVAQPNGRGAGGMPLVRAATLCPGRLPAVCRHHGCGPAGSGLSQIFPGATGIAVRAVAPCWSTRARTRLSWSSRRTDASSSACWPATGAAATACAAMWPPCWGAVPVITTATDCGGGPALDLFLQAAGLRILDWDQLPPAQACWLEGRPLPLWTPAAP